MLFLSRNGLNQVAQNLPVISRLARTAHGSVKALQTALAIDHRSALFGKTEGWQNGGRDSSGVSARIFMAMKAGNALSWATVSPISIGFSPSAISPLIRPAATPSAIS